MITLQKHPGELLLKHWTDSVIALVIARDSEYEFTALMIGTEWVPLSPKLVSPLYDTDYRRANEKRAELSI